MTKWLKKLWFKLTYDEIAMKCRWPLGKSLFIFVLMSGICSAQTSILTADVNGVTKLHMRAGTRTPVDPPPVWPPNPLSDYIGIPDPNWSLDYSPMTVTYRMYDSDANQAPGLTYRDSAEGGKYTHYIDWTADGATDTSNLFGTIATPRRTIPQNLPAGSIVEVHDTTGAGYTRRIGLVNSPYGNIGYAYFNGTGTATYPIFIRGVGTPRFYNMTIRASGAYVIIEGLDLYNEMVETSYKQTSGPTYCHHICIRNNEISYSTKGSGRMVTIPSVEDIVVYNNHIHHNGLAATGSDADVHGIGVTSSSARVWILNNEINNNDGDAIQIMGTYPDYCPQYVYVAGNTMYEDRENAVDMKYSDNCVISQNVMYGYTGEARLLGSDPVPKVPYGGTSAAILPCNEYTLHSWFLFNDINGCLHGAQVQDSEGTSANTYLIGNVFRNIKGNTSRAWDKENDTWIANIIYDVNAAIWNYNDSGQNTSAHKYYNNVIVNVIGDYSDAYRAYGDDYIAVTDDLGYQISAMRNNIFYAGGGWKWGSNSTTYATISELETARGDYCSGNLEQDPLFTDPENANFTPQVGSPILGLDLPDDAMTTLGLFYTAFGIDITGQVAQYFVDGTVYAPTGGL